MNDPSLNKVTKTSPERPIVLAYSRRLVVARAMLTAAMRFGQQQYSNVQMRRAFFVEGFDGRATSWLYCQDPALPTNVHCFEYIDRQTAIRLHAGLRRDVARRHARSEQELLSNFYSPKCQDRGSRDAAVACPVPCLLPI